MKTSRGWNELNKSIATKNKGTQKMNGGKICVTWWKPRWY